MNVFRGLEKLLADVDFVYITELPPIESPMRVRMSYRKADRNYIELGRTVEEIVKRLLAKPRRCVRCGVTREAKEFALDPRTNRREKKCAACTAPADAKEIIR